MDEIITKVELATLEVKPGQILVVTVRGNPRFTDLEKLQSILAARLPAEQFVIVSEAVAFTVIDAPAA